MYGYGSSVQLALELLRCLLTKHGCVRYKSPSRATKAAQLATRSLPTQRTLNPKVRRFPGRARLLRGEASLSSRRRPNPPLPRAHLAHSINPSRSPIACRSSRASRRYAAAARRCSTRRERCHRAASWGSACHFCKDLAFWSLKTRKIFWPAGACHRGPARAPALDPVISHFSPQQLFLVHLLGARLTTRTPQI